MQGALGPARMYLLLDVDLEASASGSSICLGDLLFGVAEILRHAGRL